MNSGATTARVYEGLKHRICTRGFRPGERLDPARLTQDLHSSVTPVRDALHVLTGEGLVGTRLSDGFHVAGLDAPALQDRYEWNAQVLTLALRSRRSGPRAEGGPAEQRRQEPRDAPALFLRVASQSRNSEHRLTILSLNDRLAAARLCEAEIIDDVQQEAEALCSALEEGDLPALRRAVLAYHRRRGRLANEIVRLLYR